LKALGFSKRSKGVLRILTDQLDSHVKKESSKENIPIVWWPGVKEETNSSKLEYVEKKFIVYF